MNISENVKYILESSEWKFYTNRSYTAKIQKSSPEMVYNVPHKPGYVYNFFEDSYEKVTENGYVVTGVAGEMWPVGSNTLAKYNITPEQITFSPRTVQTVETDTVYAGILIPSDIQFTLEADYGEKALLKGNRHGINHGDGDYIIVNTIKQGDSFIPDFSDSGRIINGSVFSKLYKPFI